MDIISRLAEFRNPSQQNRDKSFGTAYIITTTTQLNVAALPVFIPHVEIQEIQ